VTSPSWLRDRDARAGILALLIVLIGIATTPAEDAWAFASWAVLLVVTAIATHTPAFATLRRSAAVLPFAILFAAAVVPVRGWGFAAALVARAYLSAVAIALLTQSISAPRLFAALSRLGCPSALVLVLQFVYRYLFVLLATVRTMRRAALARGIEHSARRRAFQAAAGLIAVLFVSAHARAARIYNAMLARGYRGRMPSLVHERLGLADGALVIGAIALALTIRSRT
jgi:cobalt/nickel transport system permease protein